MRNIRIIAQGCGVQMAASLNDTATADALWGALPLSSAAQLYGQEIYFSIPVTQPEEDPQAEAPPGAIAYWPPGSAFCIFFGQTPYSPVNLLGRLHGDPMEWAKVGEGETIRMEKVE